MRLFLSNPSKQARVFQYRTDFRGDTSAPLSVEIASGAQVEIGQSWTPEQYERVMVQLHRQGARDAAEAHGHMPKFQSLLYRHEHAVDAEEIVMAHDEVVKTLEERSVAEATKGVLAFDRNANQRGRGQRLARVTEVEVIEQTAPGARRTGKEIEFGMSVDPEGRADIKLPA